MTIVLWILLGAFIQWKTQYLYRFNGLNAWWARITGAIEPTRHEQTPEEQRRIGWYTYDKMMRDRTRKISFTGTRPAAPKRR